MSPRLIPLAVGAIAIALYLLECIALVADLSAK